MLQTFVYCGSPGAALFASGLEEELLGEGFVDPGCCGVPVVEGFPFAVGGCWFPVPGAVPDPLSEPLFVPVPVPDPVPPDEGAIHCPVGGLHAFEQV